MEYINVYENEDIRLREITQSDLELVRKWRNLPEIRQWFFHGDPISKTEQEKWFEEYLDNSNDCYYIVEDKVEEQGPIGTVGFYYLEDGGVEFGRLMIGNREAKGKGYGHKIMGIFHELVFGQLDVAYVYLEVYCHNKSAILIYQRAGYEIIDKMYKNKQEVYIMKKFKDVISNE